MYFHVWVSCVYGLNRSISMQAIREGKSLRSRRYRNRPLGVFLKELGLTEGRATGIPTIQLKPAQNGSPAAHIETDDKRSYFLIDIPCHSHFSERNSSFVSAEDKAERLEQLSKVCPKRKIVVLQHLCWNKALLLILHAN